MLSYRYVERMGWDQPLTGPSNIAVLHGQTRVTRRLPEALCLFAVVLYHIHCLLLSYFQNEDNDKNGKRVFKVSHQGIRGSFEFEADNDETMEKYVLTFSPLNFALKQKKAEFADLLRCSNICGYFKFERTN